MKDCILVNADFSWILQVDGKMIHFQGHDSAEYFAEHYNALGYNVIWKR